MIGLKSITKSFSSGNNIFVALENINLHIKEGEFVALVGPSGSGKSTLLNLIGGLDQPTEGTISIKNKNISHYNDSELSEYRNKTVGFIFQEFHLDPTLTVEKNILLPTFFKPYDETAEKRAAKLIEEVELTSKAEAKTSELSGGQKQRTAIARALINNPQIVLADEPTGNLDIQTGKTIIDLLKKLHKNHKVTLVIATHDPLVAQVADRIVKIKNGKLCS